MARINNHALSLVELIVASMVSTIVLAGLFSIIQSMNSVTSSSGEGSYVSTSAKTALNKITSDATIAVGSSASSKEMPVQIGGVNTGIPVGTFCILKETAGVYPDGLPDYSTCYTQLETKILSCTRSKSPADVTPVACSTNDGTFVTSVAVNTISATNPTLTGNVFTMSLTTRMDLTQEVNDKTNKAVSDTSRSVAILGYKL